MAKYVDGFVIPVPKKKMKAYLKMAKLGCKIWMEYGALEYYECVADDVKKGKSNSFPQSVKLKPNEIVFFSFITYNSRKHRDQVMKKVMNDPRFNEFMNDMPFDGKRMIWGGFKTMVSSKA